MPLHVAARMHAFVHGLFRPSDERETRELHENVQRLFAEHGLEDAAARDDVAAWLSTDVLAAFGVDADHGQRIPIKRLIGRIFDYENLFVLPSVDWSRRYSISEYWDIRDVLNAQRQLVLDIDGTLDVLRRAVIALLEPVYANCPMLLADPGDGHDITVPTELVRSVAAIGQVIEAMLAIAFDDGIKKAGILTRLADRLEANVIRASGGDPTEPRSFTKAPKLPTRSEIKDPGDLVAAYLGGTPLANIFDQPVDFVLPAESRFEHHHIVAGSGHGKTQTLQYLIGKDLEAVETGERTVVVLDSQGDLIRKVSNLACFAPGGRLHQRIVVIDPTDVEWPVSLNLFDVGIDRLRGYAPLERERLTNSILELYDFVLGTLLAAEMTQKQSVIFRYVTRLMLHIPDATIHTLRELMEPGNEKKFAADIAKLAGTARHFFETEFASKEFEQTKKQVLRRLWGILENQTFERMFSHPRSKLDLFSEMNAGKVILVNTAKDLLKEQGTEIFGRSLSP